MYCSDHFGKACASVRKPPVVTVSSGACSPADSVISHHTSRKMCIRQIFPLHVGWCSTSALTGLEGLGRTTVRVPGKTISLLQIVHQPFSKHGGRPSSCHGGSWQGQGELTAAAVPCKQPHSIIVFTSKLICLRHPSAVRCCALREGSPTLVQKQKRRQLGFHAKNAKPISAPRPPTPAPASPSC
jgi:hypothetical protein